MSYLKSFLAPAHPNLKPALISISDSVFLSLSSIACEMQQHLKKTEIGVQDDVALAGQPEANVIFYETLASTALPCG